MFDELEKYKEQGHFFFQPGDVLELVCNAPKDASGLYLVYALKRGGVSLVYIGISGMNRKIIHQKDGLHEQFVTGEQFGDLRKVSWPRQMKLENIEALDVYWYVTYGFQDNDLPEDIERVVMQKYISLYGELPGWNRLLKS